MLNSKFGRRLACGAIALAGAVAGPPSTHADQAPLRQEYFIRQGQDEALLIRIDGHEADFVATVFTIEDERVTSAGVPGQRAGPLFLHVDETSEDRQLDIQVTATRHTARSRFDMALYRINVHDQRSGRLDRGYRMLAFGLQPPGSDDPASWTVKLGALDTAAEVFSEFGMDEFRLWARYYEAWLTLDGLGDATAAVDLADRALADPALPRLPRVGLAFAQVALEAARVDPGPGDVEARADEVATRAIALDERLARAGALAASADAFAEAEDAGIALSRYDAALTIADGIGAEDLSTSIRERLVDLHGRHGDAVATGDVLRQIESRFGDATPGEALAQNLLAQGRLLNAAWRFHEAESVLAQALDQQRNSATRAQIQLERARAAWETGRDDLALELAREAAWLPASRTWRRVTPLLDVVAALGIIAAVHRSQGDFTAMTAARQAQRDRLESSRSLRAWTYEHGLDLASSPEGVSKAAAVFARLAETSSGVVAGLARLQACVLGERCDASTVRAVATSVIGQGTPRDAAEARDLLARYLQRRGDEAAAIAAHEVLVDEMRFLRETLPGALGAWYWRNRDPVLDRYVDLLMRAADPQTSMLGLARARAAASAEPMPDAPPFEDLRNALARPGDDGEARRRAVARLAELRRTWSAGSSWLAPGALDTWLGGLPSDAAVVDVHLGDRQAWLLVGRRSGVDRIPLGVAAGTRERVDALAAQLELLSGEAFDAAAARVGERLIAPAAGRLPRRLYWVASGPLLRLNPAALRVDGRFLGDTHDIIESASFPANPPGTGECEAPASGGTFVAGGTSDYTSSYLDRLVPEPELRVVADRFVGPDLVVVQGAALQSDEFDTDAFRSAIRIHIAAPALLDLENPSRSWLELSEPRRGEGRERLDPGRIGEWRLAARSVFLSRSRLQGQPDSRFRRDLPVVDSILDAGAGCVVWSMWPDSAVSGAAFIDDFYESLARTGDAVSALGEARRASIAAVGDSRDWSRYRLRRR